jgi:glycosyltransferase involved in cell wall biosynthesis
MPPTLNAAIGQVAIPRGVSYTLHEVLDHAETTLRKRLWCLTTQLDFPRDYHQPVFAPLLWRSLCRLGVSDSWQARRVYRRAARALRPGDIMYVWPPFDSTLIQEAKERGAIVIAERINCMGRTCRDALEPAYARLGRNLPDGWCLPQEMELEESQMRACDFVTAPNPFVAESLRRAGIESVQILETSYGWSPARFKSAIETPRSTHSSPIFLFVGLGIVRKGLDLLLEHWERANVEGELRIAGHIDEEIRTRCARQLARADVKELGYVSNMAAVFAEADVFVFPSHEEGGPQVTYEAAGCGLPCLVSPMGAGRIVRDGAEGFVIQPFDEQTWVETLRILAGDSGLRSQLGASAALRAKEFTWELVGARFGYLLHERVLRSSI